MFYYLKIYTKYTFTILFLFLIFILFYKVYQFQNPVYLEFGNYTVYVKQNIIMFLFITFCYICYKIFKILISINSFIYSFRYKFFERISTVKSYFNFKQKTEKDIIKEIIFLKRKKLYKSALKLTLEHHFPSDKTFFWRLFLLLKLGRRREFFNIFISQPTGNTIRLFTDIYLKKMFKIRRIFLVRKLYFENPDNQIFTFIYANSLFKRGHTGRAKTILMNFLNNKKMLMVDIHCSYLMNLLAIKLEKKLNGESSNDFTLNYKENIEMYHEKKKK